MDIHYIVYPLDGLLMVGMPLALAIYLIRKFNLGWRLWWIGAAGFILSQVGHIPFNALLLPVFTRLGINATSNGWQFIAFALIAGLSAGLWEEWTRYAVFRWWAKDALSWRKALLLGAGHGGAEAIILGVIVLYSFVYMTALRGADLSTVVPANQLALAQQQVNAYWSAPWYVVLLGAVERAFSIPTQIAFAVIVWQAFARQQARWVWYAVAWHAVIDAVFAVISVRYLGIYIAEGLMGLIALLNIGLIFALRRPEPLDEQIAPTPLTPINPTLPPVEETLENLDQTRYN